MGTLYLVATPIGNLEDISIRALKTLFSVEAIACEDTRRTGLLLHQLEMKYTSIIRSNEVKRPQLISFYDEVEAEKTDEIIDFLKQGKNIALVSDAGTPLLADPGYKLVRACIREGIKIVSLPGPSAVLTALTVSGLPLNTFTFLGFLPQKQSKRKELLEETYSSPRPRGTICTFVAYETPHRINATLTDMKEIFGDIEIVIARELTKIHEEVLRGKISEIEKKTCALRGELVLIFCSS